MWCFVLDFMTKKKPAERVHVVLTTTRLPLMYLTFKRKQSISGKIDWSVRCTNLDNIPNVERSGLVLLKLSSKLPPNQARLFN